MSDTVDLMFPFGHICEFLGHFNMSRSGLVWGVNGKGVYNISFWKYYKVHTHIKAAIPTMSTGPPAQDQ